MAHFTVIDTGIVPYKDAWALQKEIVREKKSGISADYLILTEHPGVLTIGRRGSIGNIIADERSLKEDPLEIVHADRGGDITFHGPGQVVAYPIFDLRNYTKDVRLFIRKLEKVIALTIKDYGIEADTNNEYTGTWTGGSKIGFIGIGLSNWITYHGISLNANVDLRYFSMIKPCGIEGVKITSMQKILGKYIEMASLKKFVAEKFCEVFGFGDYYFTDDAFMAVAEPSGSGHK